MRIVSLFLIVSGTLLAQNTGLTARQLYLQEDPAPKAFRKLGNQRQSGSESYGSETGEAKKCRAHRYRQTCGDPRGDASRLTLQLAEG